VRKYLHDRGAALYEEPQTQEQDEKADAAEPNIALAESEPDKVAEGGGLATRQPLLAFGEAGGAAADATTRLRRGFLKQLLSRFSSGQE